MIKLFKFIAIVRVYIATIKFLPSLNRISNSLQYIIFNFPTTVDIESELNSIIKNNNDQKVKEIALEKITFENSIALKNFIFLF